MKTPLLLILAGAALAVITRKSKPAKSGETSVTDLDNGTPVDPGQGIMPGEMDNPDDRAFPIIGRDGGRYRLIRPESTLPGGIINIAIYEKQGDLDHEYMLSAGGDFLSMAKGGW